MRTFLILAGKEGVSAWTAAAALVNAFYAQPIRVLVIEPDAIQSRDDRASLQEPIVDACLPSLRSFHALLKIPERELMSKTNATFNVGTCYQDWSHQGQQFLHTHTPYGSMLEAIDFHQYTSMLHQLGDTTAFDAYSLAAQAAHQGRFAFISKEDRQKGLRMDYTMHLDLLHYAKFMRGYTLARAQQALQLGAQALQLESRTGNFKEAEIDSDSGFLQAVILESGEKIHADFFIDCSGSAAYLSKGLPHTIPDKGIRDISTRLPATHTVNFFTQNSVKPQPHLVSPFTTLIPHAQGWSKSIPLKDRVLHSWHYVATQLTESELIAATVHSFKQSTQAINHELVENPWVTQSTPQHHTASWNKNCLALGAAAADFSDLALSYLHLVQAGILRFIELFPSDSFFAKGDSSLSAEQYNQLTQAEYARIIDFHQLQLVLCKTHASDFWQEYKHAPLSQELAHKINLFKERGKIAFYEHETWQPPLWIALLLGNNLWPEKYETRLNDFELEKLVAKLNDMKLAYKHYASKLPEHAEFLAKYAQ